MNLLLELIMFSRELPYAIMNENLPRNRNKMLQKFKKKFK